MKRIQCFFRPFGELLPLFLVTWLFASAADLYYWIKYGDVLLGCHLAILGFIISYFAVFLVGLLRNKYRTIGASILVLLGVANLIADSLCYTIYHSNFVMDVVAICMGSNIDEATSFIGMYLNRSVVLFICFVLISSILVYWFRTVIARERKWLVGILSCVLCIFIGKNIVSPSKHWGGVFLNKIYLVLSYKTPEDLDEYRTKPSLSIIGDQPEKVVLIIGESLTKSHCSTYGYELETMPKLDSLIELSQVISFSNVVAAHHTTVEAMEKIMTTFDGTDTSVEWFRCLYLMDLMQAAGYSTCWISNQSSSGLADNVVSKLAALSEKVVWVGESLSGAFKHDYDELVLPEVQSAIISGQKQFIVVHLMGQHEDFKDRYPSNWQHFEPQDINDWRTHWISQYDNAVLYNDYIVSSIMKMFEPYVSAVLYFPDHGLDIFVSDDSYAGHARPSNPVSMMECTSIPFYFYSSPEYKKQFSDDQKALESNVDMSYNTENIIYTLKDIANVHVDVLAEPGKSLLGD